MINSTAFQEALGRALAYTVKIPTRRDRFLRNVLGAAYRDEAKRKQLRDQLEMFLDTGLKQKAFGKFSGAIQLRESPWEGPELLPGQDIVFVIDCRTRKLCKFDFTEFVAEQARKKGWMPPPIDG